MPVEITQRMLSIPPAVASRYARRGTDAFDELYGVGNLALVLAARAYDPERSPDPDAFVARCVGRAVRLELGLERSTARNRDGSPRRVVRSADRWRAMASLCRVIGADGGRGEPPCPRRDHDRVDDADLLGVLLGVLEDPRDRRAYVARHGHGMSLAEAAAASGIRPGSIGERLARAQELLAAEALRRRGSKHH